MNSFVDPSLDSTPRCLVVMYHYVHHHEVPLHQGLHGPTPAEFGAQLDRLCRVAEPIDWPTLYAWTQGRQSIPSRSFLLTFDDGLADHARVVLPILQDRGMRGVFFVPGAILATQRVLPAHAIHLLFSRIGESVLQRELEQELARHVEARTVLASLDADAAERMYHYESPVRARLKYLLTIALPIHLRNSIVDALFERFVGSTARWSHHWYLGWDDLAEMETMGHTIGGHGFAHEPYLRLTSDDRLDDMKQIAKLLSDGLGVDRRPFSYPYGSHDEAAATACRDSGFVHAFTTEADWVTTRCASHALPRIDTIRVDATLEEEAACTMV